MLWEKRRRLQPLGKVLESKTDEEKNENRRSNIWIKKDWEKEVYANYRFNYKPKKHRLEKRPT